jgi:hypothetical protein
MSVEQLKFLLKSIPLKLPANLHLHHRRAALHGNCRVTFSTHQR